VTKAIISETEHVIAIAQDLGGQHIVVSFNSLGHFRNGLQFWGDDFFLKQGISAIGIVTLGPNWYPRRAMDELLGAVLERANGRKIVTYGLGQGGYGALKFAARLKASATLSFSPQWSINPGDVASFDRRYVRHFDQAMGNGLRIDQQDLCDCSYIFFDKMSKSDAKHASKLAALAGVKTVVTPFSINETLRIVAQGRGVAGFISLCTSATPPPATDLRQLIRASQRQSSVQADSILRQLLWRMSRSRSHSSAFVRRLLDRNKNLNPFYAAVVAYAKGNASLALSELAKVTAKDFRDIDLLSWWHLAHKLRFFDAELALAMQIAERHPTDTVACLQTLNTLISAGNLEGAYRELLRLAKHEDATNRVASFIEFSSKLQKPDILEYFLSKALPQPARVLILFSLVDLYQQVNDRRRAFRKLMDLAAACVNSPEDLRKVADYSAKLNEVAFALDIRERLLQSAPQDYRLALDVVEARIPSDKMTAHAELKQIMSRRDLPSVAWEQASRLYGGLSDTDAALQAITKAVSLPDASPAARHRLAAMLGQKGQTRRARRELAALLAESRADPSRLRAAADLALILRDRKLAQKFAEAQFQRAPTDPECILYLARHSRLAGDLSRAKQLLSSLLQAERLAPSMSGQQWIKLAQELYDAGNISLAKEAVVEAVAREPKSAVARKLAATIALREKFHLT